MLISSVVMVMWCVRPPSGAGFEFVSPWTQYFTIVLYALSVVTALTALIFARSLSNLRYCQALGTVQMSAIMLLALSQWRTPPLVLLPLGFLTFLYLLAVTMARAINVDSPSDSKGNDAGV